MEYPIAIKWGDQNTATGIFIPDIPGAFTAGKNFSDAYQAAYEIAHLQLEKLVEQGKPIPMPTTIEHHRHLNPDFEGWIWEMIDIDTGPYLGVEEE